MKTQSKRLFPLKLLKTRNIQVFYNTSLPPSLPLCSFCSLVAVIGRVGWLQLALYISILDSYDPPV